MPDEVKWIKITTSMFDDEKIRVIHDFPEGAEILLIWVKLLCMAGKANANGYIFISESIPYTENSLASVLRSPLNIVKLALGTFENMGMITRDEKGIFINNFAYYQNQVALQIIRGKWAAQKRITREHAKLLRNGVVQDNVRDDVQDMSKTNSGNQAQNLNKTSNVLDMSKTPLIDIDKELEYRVKNIDKDNKIIKEKLQKKETELLLSSDTDKVMRKFTDNKISCTHEELRGILRKYGNDLVVKALREAVCQNNLHFPYVVGILKNWGAE